MVEIKSGIESNLLNEHKNIKFPKRLMSQTIEKNKPLILDKKILDKRKIITNSFNHKFGRYFFGFQPVAFEIFKINFAKYFFHSESPLLDECRILKKIFKKKKKKRKKIMPLQNKINVGELYFCSLKSKKTKEEINEANIKEKFFGHSKNYSSLPSRDVISMEFYKVKKEDEKKKNLKYYRYSKEAYSSEKNSDSNSEKIDLSQIKINQGKNNILILGDKGKDKNNLIKIDENDYSFENSNDDIKQKKLNFINNSKSKNKTQEILMNLNNRKTLYSTHPSRNLKNMVYNKTTFNTESSRLNKVKINLKNPKKLINNNKSISYNSKYLNYINKNRKLNKPYKFYRLKEYNNQKDSLNDNSDSYFHNKESCNTNVNINENLFRKRSLITPHITKKSKPFEINHPKKLKYKRTLDNKIVKLNTYIKRCNNKLIKLIDINKTSVSKNSFSLKESNENTVDIKKILIDKNIKLKEPDNEIEIQQILKDAQTTYDKNVKNPKKEKRNFKNQIFRMSDDMALFMVDKLYKTEIDLKCKRSEKIEIELDQKKKKEKDESKFEKIRERTKQNYNQMINLKTQLDLVKNKMLI